MRVLTSVLEMEFCTKRRASGVLLEITWPKQWWVLFLYGLRGRYWYTTVWIRGCQCVWFWRVYLCSVNEYACTPQSRIVSRFGLRLSSVVCAQGCEQTLQGVWTHSFLASLSRFIVLHLWASLETLAHEKALMWDEDLWYFGQSCLSPYCN